LPGSEIAISGAELVKRIRTGYIPQFPHEAMVPDLPVIENLYLRSILFAMRGTATPFGWFKRLTCISSLKAFRETFIQMPGAEELLKGRHFDNCRSFSGGELQMLNLMALTCANIELLIMDEPTSKLDDANRMRFWALVAELMKGREFTVIATTHEASVFNSNTTGCDPIFMQIHNQKIEIDCGGHDTERKTLHASSA
jgi:ABC-type multidrug transport system ATPase subunit